MGEDGPAPSCWPPLLARSSAMVVTLDINFGNVIYLIMCQCLDNGGFCDIFTFFFLSNKCFDSFLFNAWSRDRSNDSHLDICVIWRIDDHSRININCRAIHLMRCFSAAEYQNKQLKLRTLTYMASSLLKSTNLIIHFLNLALLKMFCFNYILTQGTTSMK